MKKSSMAGIAFGIAMGIILGALFSMSLGTVA